MSSEWRVAATGDLIARGALVINDGYRAKNSELGGDGLPFARAGNVNGRIELTDADILCSASVARAGEKVSEPGDSIFTSKGTVGRFAFVREDARRFVYSPQLCFWRVVDREVLDPRFVFFWLQGPEAMAQLNTLKGQTDMADYVSLRDQRAMQVTLPPLDEQRRIAGVLGALDDKIEHNSRLEPRLFRAVAELYRHYFPSVLGGTPLREHVQVIRGRSYKSAELQDSRVALVTLKSVKRGGGYVDGGLKAYIGDFKGDQVVEPGDVVVAHTDLTQDAAVVGKPALVPCSNEFGTLVASLDLAIVRPVSPSVSRLFLYSTFLTEDFQRHAYGYANGSTVLHLAKDAIPDFEIALPDSEAILSFDTAAQPLVDRALSASAETSRLASIRGTLLPKLVSGQVRVPESYDPSDVLGTIAAEAGAPTP